jgi:hypothetical protein
MRTSTLVSAVAVSAALLLAGCGGSSGGASASTSPTASGNGVAGLTADQILARTTAAARAQTSVHVSGKGSSGADAIGIDMTMSKGKGGYGTITLGGSPLQVVSDGTTVYFKGDKAFWTAQASAAAATVIGDRWLTAPVTNQSFASLAQFADFDSSITGFLSPDGAITKGAQKDIAGAPAVELKSGSGSLWVATSGDPLPVQISTGKPGEELTFADWGTTIDVTAKIPAEKDTIDLSQLGG